MQAVQNMWCAAEYACRADSASSRFDPPSADPCPFLGAGSLPSGLPEP